MKEMYEIIGEAQMLLDEAKFATFGELIDEAGEKMVDLLDLLAGELNYPGSPGYEPPGSPNPEGS